MTQTFNIVNDTVVISKLSLTETLGNFTHTGDVNVVGTINADTINVKNLITESGNPVENGNWTYPTEVELTGKGFNWTSDTSNTQLIYRTGNRLWTNASLDLAQSASYKIDNNDVLSAGVLGSSITKSNLKEIGTLKALAVTGNATLAEFAFFNSGFGRLGLGTDEPNTALSILENDVEIGIGSPKYGIASIGTYSNHDLAITSDNIARITVKQGGEVHIGDATGSTGVLRVFGEIFANSIVTDTRLERTTPLEFKATRDSAIYGKGLLWTGTGGERSFIMSANPDRIISSESLDLAEGQRYYVGGQEVLTGTQLGRSVVTSFLTTLGTLEGLMVNGPTQLTNLSVDTASAKSVVLTSSANELNINSTGVNTSQNVSLTVQGSEVFYADANEIVLGNKANARKPVKVFGPLSVGINNPDPDVSLSVSGNVSFANKKFITGTVVPTSGSYLKGDICWNQDPKETSYVGWICVVEGTPGEWLPFGAIGRQ